MSIDSTSLPFISIDDNVVLTKDVIILAHDYSYEVLEYGSSCVTKTSKIYYNWK